MRRLWYAYPNVDGSSQVVYVGEAKFEDPWYEDWLWSMVNHNSGVIFFLTQDSTDVEF